MEPLLNFQTGLLKGVNNQFRRYLHAQINWNQRMIAIKGPRGAGKTTLLLQYLKFDLKQPDDALYITADHTWFYNHSLLETAGDWYKSGGRLLIIDEVHKYTNWSRELKNIYDGYPDMKIVFSASSALDIYRGEADLSRRVIHYSLAGLSFREFIFFTTKQEFKAINFSELIKKHRSIAAKVVESLHPLPLFKKYVQYGYLPITAEGEKEYPIKLNQVINAVVESDLSFIASYGPGTAGKVKKLLAVIAESVPFKPNISALAQKLDISRDSLYLYLTQLTQAKLINTLQARGKGISTLQKPEKIYLENTNLSFALSTSPDMGNIRETFIFNQLQNAGLHSTAPKEGDFFTEGYHIEVGGRNKTASQVKTNEKYIVASDEIEIGIGTKIPLWLFGFLY
jgi:uncharacterized protein